MMRVFSELPSLYAGGGRRGRSDDLRDRSRRRHEVGPRLDDRGHWRAVPAMLGRDNALIRERLDR